MHGTFATLVFAIAMPLVPDGMQDYLRQSGEPPAEYLLSKLNDHRIVVVGENHWQRNDAQLVAGLAFELRRLEVALAMEVFRASSQDDIDTFMAERVRTYATDEKHRVLVYCGMHHAFTHYLQVERLRKGRATEFMDRMGNILWRQFGQDVFLVALHKPWGCGEEDDPLATSCAPLGGAIDCAAVRNGGTPVGFDILGSPIAETKLAAESFYATAHPLLRMVDFVDGYIWQAPVDDTRMVELIPLEEYFPTDADRADKRAAWQKERDDLANPEKRPSLRRLPEWRKKCGLPAPRAASPR